MLALSRLGADTVTQRGCQDQYCAFKVSRSEVKAAVPVAKPHPRTRFNVTTAGWKDIDRVELELLGAGLLPLSIVQTASGRFTVDVADVLDEGVLGPVLSPISYSLRGSPAYYILQTFDVTMVAGTMLGQLRQALFEVGVVPSLLASIDANMYRVETYSVVHAAMLAQLQAGLAVIRVGSLSMGVTDELTESQWPFTYVVDFDFDTQNRASRDANDTASSSTAPSTTTVTMTETDTMSTSSVPVTQAVLLLRSRIMELVQTINPSGLAFDATCGSADGITGVCQLQTTWRITASQIATLLGQGVIQRVALDSADTLEQAVLDAVQAWIGE